MKVEIILNIFIIITWWLKYHYNKSFSYFLILVLEIKNNYSERNQI